MLHFRCLAHNNVRGSVAFFGHVLRCRLQIVTGEEVFICLTSLFHLLHLLHVIALPDYLLDRKTSVFRGVGKICRQSSGLLKVEPALIKGAVEDTGT